jgi:hypothetical protein
MDFHYLGFVNRLLMMNRQATVSDFNSVTIGDDAYKAQLCVNDTVLELSRLLKTINQETSFTISTVANQRVYSLPAYIEFPLISVLQMTDNIKLGFIDRYDYDKYIVDYSEHTGNPEAYYFEGYSAFDTQPAVGDAVTVATSIIPGSGYLLNYVYISSQYNRLINATATLSTGINTLISAGGSYLTTFVNVTLNRLPVTTVVFSNNTGGGATKTYGAMTTIENYLSIPQIGIHPIPTSVMTLYCRGYRKPVPLVNTYDIPIGFTADHINAITLGAYARLLRYKADVPVESVQSAFKAYYDEVQKVSAVRFRNPDLNIRMKSSGEYVPLNYFRPLDRWSR